MKWQTSNKKPKMKEDSIRDDQLSDDSLAVVEKDGHCHLTLLALVVTTNEYTSDSSDKDVYTINHTTCVCDSSADKSTEKRGSLMTRDDH